MNRIFNNKKILITGGTGSFGNAFVRKLIKYKIKEIRIFSRDEKKQDDMRKQFNNSKLKFYIGDIRDAESVENAVQDVDFIFHAAALKQVPSCEFYPMEAVKTNVIGVNNVLNFAVKAKVKKIICLSTDKAVYPINAMGVSKSMMEKVISAKSRNSNNTDICITSYGNVVYSRGSVIPLFVQKLKEKKDLTITDFSMTRFMMTMEDAIELVMFAFANGKNGEIFVRKSPAATIKSIVSALSYILNIKPNANKDLYILFCFCFNAKRKPPTINSPAKAPINLFIYSNHVFQTLNGCSYNNDLSDSINIAFSSRPILFKKDMNFFIFFSLTDE